MRVKDLVEKFDLTIAAGKKGLDREVLDGYCGDLLSEIMGNAPTGCAWMTVQGHQNIVAVAVLREMAVEQMMCAAIALVNQESLSATFPTETPFETLSVDVNLADGNGVTPLAHARQRGFEEIVAILESAGAR